MYVMCYLSTFCGITYKQLEFSLNYEQNKSLLSHCKYIFWE